MRSEISVSDLKSYIRDSKLYKQGLENAIDDLSLYASTGSSIHYVVDFSELFAYLLPQEASKEFFLFYTGVDEEDASLERLVLHHFLYSLPENIEDKRSVPFGASLNAYSDTHFMMIRNKVLLPPYAREFHNFIKSVKNNAFSDIVQFATKKLNARKEVLQDKDFAEILRILDEPSGDLSTRKRTVVTDFLVRNAKWLSIYYAPPSTSPLSLAETLLRRNVLQDIVDIHPALNGFAFTPNSPLELQCFHKLKEVRGPGAKSASFNDAQAIAMTIQINKFLSLHEIPIQLRFMTRSNFMHALYDSSLMLSKKDRRIQLPDELRNEMGNIIRHPRIFNILHRIRELDLESKIKDLKGRLNQVNAFIAHAETSTKEHKDSLSELQDKLNAISEEWINGQALIASAEDLIGANTIHSWTGAPKEIKRLLAALQDHDQLNSDILDRVNQTDIDFGRQYTLLGSYVSTKTRTDAPAIDILNSGGKKIIRTEFVTMPYEIVLYTDIAQRFYDDYKSKGYLQDKEKLSVLSDIISQAFYQPHHELLLLIAYISGSFNQWDTVETYCDWALSTQEETPAYHEIYLFYAICLRRFNPDAVRAKTLERLRTSEGKQTILQNEKDTGIKRFVEARGFLNKAISLRKAFYSNNDLEFTPEDARYFKEYGTQILTVNQYYSPSDEIRLSNDIPPMRSCIEYLDRAESLLAMHDEKGRIQILNNRIVFWTEILANGDELNLIEQDRLQTDLAHLEDIMNELSGPQTSWPSAILDTFAWAKWVMGQIPKREAARLVEHAWKTSTENRFNRIELRRQVDHLKMIRTNRQRY